MDGDYDDPGPDNIVGSANPSIPMTSAMTTGTSWSKVFPAMATQTHRRGIEPTESRPTS